MRTIHSTIGTAVVRVIAPLAIVSALVPSPAFALGGPGHEGGSVDDKGNLGAGVTHSSIKISYKSGGGGGGKKGNLAPIDPNWEPPVCWYEPAYTPEQLKKAAEAGEVDDAGIHEFWSDAIFIDHYDKGEANDNFDDENSYAEGYKNYNIGKDGYFWRGVAPDDSHPDSWDCGRIMFWQDAGTVPDIPNAPTPEMLAEYAYDKVKVPDTEVELKPEAKSTVNLPTWVWLDKGTFKDVKVRADLPHTNLWAETTAKPKSLHLEPGTADAETFPASGECKINEDGSIGTPYTKGKSKQDPPCGISYLRATDGKPYQLKASITWEISWEGSDDDGKHMLPEGTFETTQDMDVQEIQSINR